MIGATTWRSWIIHEFAEAIRNFAKIARWVMSPIVSGESDGEIGDLDEDVSYDEKPCNSYTAVIYICTDCTTFKMNQSKSEWQGRALDQERRTRRTVEENREVLEGRLEVIATRNDELLSRIQKAEMKNEESLRDLERLLNEKMEGMMEELKVLLKNIASTNSGAEKGSGAVSSADRHKPDGK